MLVRFVFVVLIVGLTMLAVRSVSRRKRSYRGGIPQGLTLVTASGCGECQRAARALDSAGVEYVVVDASESEALGIKTMSVPVAVVGDSSGAATMVRRGTAIAADASRLGVAVRSVSTV